MKAYIGIAATMLGLVLAGICILVGGSKGSVAPVPPVLIEVVSAQSNPAGAAVVQLSFTNTTARSILVGGRSVIEQQQRAWATNYSSVPMFVGLAGAGSMASDLTLGAGAAMTVTLSPVKVSGPFRLEFVCFPQRKGLPGVTDAAMDKVQTWKDGGQHDTYRGASFFPVSPVIAAQTRSRAKGPLRVHQKNPRYFDDGTGRAVYLTGSHTWYNFQDGGASNPPPVLDYDRYLDWMVTNNHNFIRLWVWEQARWAPWADGTNGNASDWFIRPAWAYARTGPGKALDGEPKFDLAQFNPAYFNRLRERVQKAQAKGIYVSIMLFQGWSSAKGWLGGKPWNGHPYHPQNNIQQFNGNEHSTDGPDLSSKALREMHVAYLRRVVDAVNDADNVLYEVTNEGGYKDWDWLIVDQVHAYEKTKPQQHPVGLTGHGSESNDEMIASPADWFSPGEREWPDLKANPRAVDGRKVSLVDTDHVFGVGGDQQWIWKCFTRGHNVLFMDPYMDRNWEKAGGGGYDTTHENARKAMGITRRYAVRMDLAATAPHNELASTTYCLANPGKEYLVYAPNGGEVTMDLSAANGKFEVEWCHPVSGAVVQGEPVEGGERRSLTSPNPGEAVLYLRR